MGFLDNIGQNFGSYGDTSGLSTSEQISDIDRRRQLAQALISQGAQSSPLIHAGPFVVGGGIGGTLAKALQVAGGALADKSLGQQEIGLKQQRSQQLGDALKALTGADQNLSSPAPQGQPPQGQPPQGATPPPQETPPILQPQRPPLQGSIGTASDGLPEVTVNGRRPEAAGGAPFALPSAPAGTQSGPAPSAAPAAGGAPAAGATPAASPMDPTAARHAAALRALQGMPPDMQQQLVGQLAAQDLQPRPLIKVGENENLADALTGEIRARGTPVPKSDLAKLEHDHNAGLISDSEYAAKLKMEEGQNSNIVWESDGQVKRAFDAKTGKPVPGIAPIKMQLTPQEQRNATMFGGREGALMAALADRGIALPAGFRSREQQQALLSGLLTRHDGMSADDIADGIRTGQLGFTADKKAALVAGGQVGKVSLGLNEMRRFAPLAIQASVAVPRGNFMPIAKLLQMGDEQLSDPNLRDLKIKTVALLNAYDQVAARSGTDVGKRERSQQLLMAADSPETYARAVRSFTQEGVGAKAAAKDTIDEISGKAGAASAAPGPEVGTTQVFNGKTYISLGGGRWAAQQ